MEFKIRADTTGLTRRFALLIDSVRDLNAPLRQFDGYIAARVGERFAAQGPGWAPLAPETIERRRGREFRRLERKLGRDVWRAAGKVDDATRIAEASGLSPWAGDVAGALAADRRRARSLQTFRRRIGTLAELRRHLSGTAQASMTPGLMRRAARAEAKATGRILGRIAGSFRSRIHKGTLVRESEIAWAGVHNEGGSAGHGAKIPARPFLFLDERDVDVLVNILRSRMLIAFERG